MGTLTEEITLQIVSAKTRKFKNQGRVLDVEYNEIIERDDKIISTRGIVNKDKKGEIVADSLLKSLKAFIPHLLLNIDRANINDFTGDYFKNQEYLKKKYDYEVTGAIIKEFNGHNHVVLIWSQHLKSGKSINNLKIPMIKYDFDPDADKEEKYVFHKELKEAIDGYLTEVEKYLNGEHAQPAQTSLKLDGNPQDESDDTEVVKEVKEEKPKAEAKPKATEKPKPSKPKEEK